MNLKEAEKKLKESKKDHDLVLVAFLKGLGYTKLAAAYEKKRK